MKPTPLSKPVVLLIDESETDNYINERILKLSGFADTIYSRRSVDGALEFIYSHQGSLTGPYSIYIFLDLCMPINDGFTFLDNLKKNPPSFKGDLKIIVLTNSLNPQDREKAEKYEVEGFLEKPLTFKDLQTLDPSYYPSLH